MTVSVKRQGLSVPETITRKAGIKPGDLVEVAVRQGAIAIHAAAQLNESRDPLYTPTKSEAAAIRRCRAAYKRGDSIALSKLHDVVTAIERRTSSDPAA